MIAPEILDDDEKSWLARRLEGEERTRMRAERHSVGEAMKDPRVLTFGLLYFCMVVRRSHRGSAASG